VTVTFYTADFTDASGRRFVGQVYWDKLHQRQVRVSICPETSADMLDYPAWESSGTYRSQVRAEMEAMVKKLKRKADKLGLTLKSEQVTHYAPPASRR